MNYAIPCTISDTYVNFILLTSDQAANTAEAKAYATMKAREIEKYLLHSRTIEVGEPYTVDTVDAGAQHAPTSEPILPKRPAQPGDNGADARRALANTLDPHRQNKPLREILHAEVNEGGRHAPGAPEHRPVVDGPPEQSDILRYD